MKIILLLVSLLPVAGRVGAAEAPTPAPAGASSVPLTPAYLNELAEEMRTNQPALRAVAARARAASFNTNSVRAWDDPAFKFGGVTASSSGPKLSEEGDLVYGVEQRLPLFGKEKAARHVAQAEAETESARLSWQFQALRRDLAKAAFKAALADRVLAIGAQDLGWLHTLVATAEERYRAGSATQVELLRLQNERARRADQLRTDELLRDHTRLAVNRLLNRDLGAALPLFELPPVAPPVEYTPRLVDLALKFEPKLRVMRREIQRADASVAATRKSRLPDLSAGVEGRQYTGDGGFREGIFMISLSVPWLNAGKYRSDLARDRARLQAAELDEADYQLTLREDLHNLTVNIDAARRQALLYRDEILPRSEQALDSARANWLADRGLFLDVMEARRMLLEAQLISARAVSEQYQALSELVLCCGLGDLEALEQFRSRPDATPQPLNQP